MKARIPADVEMPDRIIWGLTLRQLAILAGDALVLWGVFLGLGNRAPVWLLGLALIPVGVMGLIAVGVRPAGLPVERFAYHFLRQSLGPKKMVPAPEGIPDSVVRRKGLGDSVTPLFLPFKDITTEGVLDLGSDGRAVVCQATSVNFGLRSEAEQDALVAGFARVLNSLDGPAQFLIRSDRTDAAAMIASLEKGAQALPNPGLKEAALEYGRFIHSVTSDRAVLNRSILVCLRDPMTNTGQDRVLRRVQELAAALRELGVRIIPLTGPETAGLIRRAADPEALFQPVSSLPAEPIRGIAR